MQNGVRQGTGSFRFFRGHTATPSKSNISVIKKPQTFSVGTGLSHQQRKQPPKIGAIIVYRFQELTKSGVPRCVFLVTYFPFCGEITPSLPSISLALVVFLIHVSFLVDRFPSYVGEAVDKTEAKDAEVPEHRKVNAAAE